MGPPGKRMGPLNNGFLIFFPFFLVWLAKCLTRARRAETVCFDSQLTQCAPPQVTTPPSTHAPPHIHTTDQGSAGWWNAG